MKVLTLLIAGLASAGGQKSLPALVPVLRGPGAAAVPVVLPANLLPQTLVPLAPMPAPQPGAPRTIDALQGAARFLAPEDGRPAQPGAADALYDGGPGPQEAAFEPEDFAFSALPVEAQLARSGWFQGRAKLIPWADVRQGEGWGKFYAALYKSLSEKGPAGYRQDTPKGPVFHLGGHDVVQAILGVGRSELSGEVNLYARYANPAQLAELWQSIAVDAGAQGKLEIDLNPESTPSLQRMMEAGRGQDALDRAQNNILLKWNLVSLTPEGIEVRGLDLETSQDLALRRLRLSANRGPLSAYEAQYNLIVAYRAMRETGKPWHFEERTKRFFAESLVEMPTAQLEQALAQAARSPTIRGTGANREGMSILLSFIERALGRRAADRARAAAREMPAAEGGTLELGVPQSLVEAAQPFATKAQLARLQKTPSVVPGRARFALIGDAEPGRFWFSRALFNVRGVFERFLRRADAEAVDFILQLGDMVSVGTPENYRAFFGALSAIRPLKPYLSVIGNHDRASPHGVSHARVYRTLFGRDTDYSFDRDGVRFIALDSSAGRLSQEQLDWLDRTLDFSGPRIIFTHIPPYYLDKWTGVPGIKGVGGFNQGAQRFREIVQRRKVARVYVGHIHAFDALEMGGVRYVLTGGGGSALFPVKVRGKFHHYLVVEAGPDGISELVQRDDGSAFQLVWPR